MRRALTEFTCDHCKHGETFEMPLDAQGETQHPPDSEPWGIYRFVRPGVTNVHGVPAIQTYTFCPDCDENFQFWAEGRADIVRDEGDE